MLDVLATISIDRDVRSGAGEFLTTVGSLMGQEERGYWDQISRML